MRVFRLLLLCIFLLGFISVGFADCNLYSRDSTVDAEVSVGSYDYKVEDVSRNNIFVREDLGEYNIDLGFSFKINDADCLNASDVSFRLTSSGLYQSPSSFNVENLPSQGYAVVTASFESSSDVGLPSSFTGNIKADKLGLNENVGFRVDEMSPVINSPDASDYEGRIYAPGAEELTSFQIDIEDNGAGIGSLEFDGDMINDSVNSNDFSKEIEKNITETGTVPLVVTDNVGISKRLELNVTVDTDTPRIREVRKESIEASRSFDLYAKVKDSSIPYKGCGEIDVKANLSAVTGLSGWQDSRCSEGSNDDTCECSWENLQKGIEEDKTLDVGINATDFTGESIVKTISMDFNVDYSAPNIKSFKVKNFLGKSNLVTSHVNNESGQLVSDWNNGSFRVVVEFEEESGIGNIEENFGDFSPVASDYEHDINEEEGRIVWELDRKYFASSYFSGARKAKVPFEVKLCDEYGQCSVWENFNVTLDNVAPEVNKTSYVDRNEEKRLVRGNLLYSGANINYKVLIEDNIEVAMDNVYADFRNVALNPETSAKMKGECAPYEENSNLTECNFKDIKLMNGFVNDSVYVYAFDVAGNLHVYSENLTIYKIGNETKQSFYIDDINITSPLNRDLLLKNQNVPGWFEGEIKNLPKMNMTVINYDFKGCNNSMLAPLAFYEDPHLYPEVDRGTGRSFVLRTLLEVPNDDVNSLNPPVKTECTMSVSRKDNTTIYKPQLTNFTIHYSFYGLPGGTVTEKHADKLKGMLEDKNKLGKEWDDYYQWYKTASDICTGMNMALGTLSSVAAPISILAESNIPYISSGAQTVASVIDPTASKTSVLAQGAGWVDTYCKYVTCGYAKEFGIGEWLKEMQTQLNMHTSGLSCLLEDKDKDKDKDKKSSSKND